MGLIALHLRIDGFPLSQGKPLVVQPDDRLGKPRGGMGKKVQGPFPPYIHSFLFPELCKAMAQGNEITLEQLDGNYPAEDTALINLA